MKTIQNDAEMFGFKPNISAYIGVLTRDDANQLVLKDLLNHILHFKGLNSTKNVQAQWLTRIKYLTWTENQAQWFKSTFFRYSDFLKFFQCSIRCSKTLCSSDVKPKGADEVKCSFDVMKHEETFTEIHVVSHPFQIELILEKVNF